MALKTMHRFFVPPHSITGNRAVLHGTIVHQIRDVLRMRPGDRVVLLDNSGQARDVELETIDKDAVRGRVSKTWKPETEPRARITLYQGLLKGQKFEWVLQKGTEIGISAFVPVLAARCVIGSMDDVSDARVERWERIVVEAAEQSGRAVLPHLAQPLLFDNACSQAARAGPAFIPWEAERTLGLRQALQGVEPGAIGVLIGPEGGFEEEEIALARDNGLVPVSLGPRILRAETAGLAAASAILYAMGDLG
jgi:16S rRNA (uracil1498-N3)-methyltransferase